MAAENYHLKWDSHLSYLNSSVATLYKNEKFADVVLYSSNSNTNGNSDIPTVGISAHKFILSSCSQFFATMFETAPIIAPNGVFYIVLPPDLSHRAIQILVQYMYSGEATVSNDILNEVLRGGEILKIRGLCRTSSSSSHHSHQLHNQREPSAASHYSANGTRTSLPSLPGAPPPTQLPSDVYGGNSKCTASSSTNCGSSSRYAIEHTAAQQQQFRGLGASVMPKDSPVIVKSPKLTHPGLLSIASGSGKHHSGISINKEVAIDPEEKCCYQAPVPQTESLHAVPPPPPQTQSMSICTEVGCRSCPMASDVEVDPIIRRRHRSSRSDDRIMEREYVEPRPPDDHTLCERDDVATAMVFDRRLRRESASERIREYFAPENFEHAQINTKPFVEPPTVVGVPARLPTPPHPHNFMAIKQEPSDWSNSAPTPSENSDDGLLQHRPTTPSLLSPKQPLDFKMPLGSAAVKLETNSTSCSPDEDDKHYNNFKLLLCEICQKSFEDTKTLVRHLETHAADNIDRSQAASGSNVSTLSNTNGSVGDVSLPKSYVPKKRRRISQQENNMDHVTLLCDLCTTSFETPAEWVRHMNNQHTEIELAMFNSKRDGEQKNSNDSASISASVNGGGHNNNTNSSNNNESSCSATSSTQNQLQQSTTTTHKKYTNTSRHRAANTNTGPPTEQLNTTPSHA